jgi:hypothetical protein
MKKTLLAVVMAAAAGFSGVVPRANAAAGDSIKFNMVHADGATCIPATSHARVTITDQGPVQKMHIEAFQLTPNTSFTTFIVQHSARPFGLSWYQGEIETDSRGRGVADFTGIFSAETFVLADTAIPMAHIGIWYADPVDAANAGCPNIVTPFDGDHEAGILVLSTGNFADDKGPLLRLK